MNNMLFLLAVFAQTAMVTSQLLRNYTIEVVAGNGGSNVPGDNGPAIDAGFELPTGLCFNASATDIDYYVSDLQKCTIRRILGGRITTAVGVFGDCYKDPSAPLEGNPTELYLGGSYGCIVYNNTLIFADAGTNRVRMIGSDGVLRTLIGNTSLLVGNFSGDAPTPARSAWLNNPFYLDIDYQRQVLYISDYTNNRIRAMDLNTGMLTTVAGSDLASDSNGDGGPATSAFIQSPTGIAVDPFVPGGGQFYFVTINQIRGVFPNRTIFTLAGTGDLNYGGDGGPALEASFQGPYALAMHPTEHLLFVADTQSNCVRYINLTDHIVYRFAGQCGASSQSSPASGPALAAFLNLPEGLAFHPFTGDLYIAETGNSKIRRVYAASMTPPLNNSDQGSAVSLIVAITVSVVVLVVIVIGCAYCRTKRQDKHTDLIPLEEQAISLTEVERGKQIGAGNFGLIFAAGWRGQEVALKEPNGIVTETIRDDFFHEISVFRRLGNHAYIPNFIGCSAKSEPRPFLLMELLPFGCFEDLFITHSRLPPPAFHLTLVTVLTLAKQISSALIHLHKQGVIHGDLACRNVLVDFHGELRARLIDFGLSHILSPGQVTVQRGAGPIPVATSAPETLSRGICSTASDIYMLAFTFWEMFTCQLVPVPDQVARLVLVQHYRPEIPDHVPRYVRELIERMWVDDPAARPDIVAVHTQLTTFLSRSFTDAERTDVFPAQHPPLRVDSTRDHAQGFYDVYTSSVYD